MSSSRVQKISDESDSDSDSFYSENDFDWPEEEHDNVLEALRIIRSIIYQDNRAVTRSRPPTPVNVNLLTHGVVSDLEDYESDATIPQGYYDSDATTPQTESLSPSPTLPLLHNRLNESQVKNLVYETLTRFFDLQNDERVEEKIDFIAENLYPAFGTNETEDISRERRDRRFVVVQYLYGKEYEKGPPAVSGGKKNSNRILPQLKPVTMKNKKYTYKLNDPPSLRHKAIDEGIRYENKHMNKTKKQAAISKKGRFNILRIYRRNNNLKECNILTKDMEYMDKKYKLGKTSKICSKKKGKNSKKKKSVRKKSQKKKKISKRKSLKRN